MAALATPVEPLTLIPVVLGIAGHRDLRPQDVANLEAAVERVIVEVREVCPHTPLMLLSSLAEGADRLAAGVAIRNQVRLIAPLPMPREEYEKDFLTPESRREFADLLASAAAVLTLPQAESIPPGIDSRDVQYQIAGAFVARHAQILIVLWDGQDGNQPAGTAWVVRYRTTGSDEASGSGSTSLLAGPDDGPLMEVVTARSSSATPPTNVAEVRVHYPPEWGNSDQARGTYWRLLQETDAYNQDVRAGGPKLAREAKQSLEDLAQGTLEEWNGPARAALSHHATADALAVRFRNHRRTSLICVLILVVVGVFFLETYIERVLAPSALWLYPIALASAWGIARFAKAREFQRRYLDYRALAEGLRLMVFWRLAGVRLDVADHYLHLHRSELDWIRHALRACSLPGNPAEIEHDPHVLHARGAAPGRLDLVQRLWVDRQKSYFRGASMRDEKELKRREAIAGGLWGLAVAISVILALGHGVIAKVHGVHEAMLIGLGVSLAGAAAFTAYVDRMLFSEQTRQFSTMAALFGRYSDAIARRIESEDVPGAQALLQKLGEEALKENADWFHMFRARPITLPKG